MRKASIKRETKETNITLELNLDGSGKFQGSTGVPFMDHMLDLWSYHSGCDLLVDAHGDLEIDGHHTIEDIGICLGQAVQEALGDKKGINRYGAAWIPMDEALAMAVLDFSGRPYLYYQVLLKVEKIGSFDVELAEEFFKALCNNGGLTLHIDLIRGQNAHHIIEAVFKAFGRAFRQGIKVTGSEIPSTKGVI